MQHSFTEENYLKIIHRLSGKDGAEVSTNAIAEGTSTRAASVTDMLRKLSEKGLLHYKKYQGVTLTEEGQNVALKVIRKHRLWEVFLVEKLGLGWDEVHEIAEELEHVTSEILVERLDSFLGHPQFDPHGDPIPDSKGNMPVGNFQKLSDLKLGEPATLMGVLDHSSEFLQHLDRVNLLLGNRLEIIELVPYDKSSVIRINDEGAQFITHAVAQNLLVQRDV